MVEKTCLDGRVARTTTPNMYVCDNIAMFLTWNFNFFQGDYMTSSRRITEPSCIAQNLLILSVHRFVASYANVLWVFGNVYHLRTRRGKTVLGRYDLIWRGFRPTVRNAGWCSVFTGISSGGATLSFFQTTHVGILTLVHTRNQRPGKLKIFCSSSMRMYMLRVYDGVFLGKVSGKRN